MRHRLLILLVIIGLLFLGGCAWFSEGLLNVFDPKVQIRISSFDIAAPAEEGGAPTLTLNLMSLNQVGARFGTFIYEFSKKIGGTSTQLIPELSKTYSVNVLLPPGAEEAGGTATISNVPLYFQEETDYINSHPDVKELLLTLWLKGVDEADHKVELKVLEDYPILIPPPVVAALNISANPTELSPGDTSTITVKALTKYGEPINGAIINLTASGGTLSAASLVTDANGEATTTFTAGNTPGEATVTATATSGDATASVTINITAPQPATLNLTVSPSTVPAGSSAILTVQVLDKNGKPVEGATVTLTATQGTLGASSLTTDTTGYASTTLDTTGVASGTSITITAISGGAQATATLTVQ